MKTLCILTAGRGVRLNEYSTLINKALLPVNKKAAISHIIDNFPKETKLVIAIGHLGGQVKDFLNLNYSKRNITFVKIKDYSGKKSGPGKSLLDCKTYLKKDFYFISCDTLWKKKISNSENYNWMGISKELFYDPKKYCNLLSSKKKIIDVKDKIYATKRYKHFIGLAYIKDYNLFWSAFKSMKKNAGEYQVIDGFKKLIEFNTVKAKKFEWYDIGSFKNYNAAIKKYENFNFRKTNEFIYIDKNKITKFINSKIKVKKLITRTKKIKLFPRIIKFKKQFIQYKYIPGEIFYNLVNKNNFNKLLYFLNTKLWIINKNENIKKLCKKFYHTKTLERIELFLDKYNHKKDLKIKINGTLVPSIDILMSYVPWQKIYRGVPSKIHGDLQFDNIIFDKKDFFLIDWREDFGGNLNYGDLYYDLAKMYGGIEMNYDIIKKGKFSYLEKKNGIFYRYDSRKVIMNEIKQEYEEFISLKKLSLEKIEILKCLIYINMSPLHEYPFDKLLFAHGKYQLFQTLKKYEYISK
jgi:NDP-sugar pyrophosphorylase family protein